MSLLLSSVDFLSTASGFAQDFVLGNLPAPDNSTDFKSTGTSIQEAVVGFLLPLVFLAIGAIAIKFLMQRQMTQFFQFAAIAMLVLLLLLNPGLLAGIANQIANLLQ